METIAIIPARGGSKGVPRKNVRLLAGLPLIAHTIKAALASKRINRVVVSTDDDEIATISGEFGAEVIRRPDTLSGDEATSESALVHALTGLRQREGYMPDLVAFLQCTSPIRSQSDLDKAIAQFVETKLDSLLSVSPSHRFLWKLDGEVAKSVNYDYWNRPRRQDFSQQYVENGSFYLVRPSILLSERNRLGGKLGLYVMSDSSSFEIDTETDFLICESILAAGSR